jgi:hypothetical protein
MYLLEILVFPKGLLDNSFRGDSALSGFLVQFRPALSPLNLVLRNDESALGFFERPLCRQLGHYTRRPPSLVLLLFGATAATIVTVTATVNATALVFGLFCFLFSAFSAYECRCELLL